MQFQAARVGLGDPEFERVVPRLRRLALRAAQVFAPRFDLGRVDGIRTRANLQHDGVQVHGPRPVEDGDRLGLLLGR